MARIGPIEVKVNFVDTRKPAGPFKVRREAGSFVLTYPDGSEVIAPIIWNYVEAWVNSAYAIGREDERREREKMYVGKPEHVFTKGQRVKHADCGEGSIVNVHYLMGERSYWFAPDGNAGGGFETMGQYLTPLPPKPATVTRKFMFIDVPPFIGGPLDGQQLGYGDTCVETLNISAEGKPLSVTDKGHTYLLGTVNGEQMMVYERSGK